MSRLSGLYAESTLPSAMTAVSASTVESTTVSVPGAVPGDFVLVSLVGFDAPDAILQGTVTANDTVTISILADGGGASNVASGKIRIKVVPFDAI